MMTEVPNLVLDRIRSLEAQRDEAVGLMRKWVQMIDRPEAQTNQNGLGLSLLFGIQMAARAFINRVKKEW